MNREHRRRQEKLNNAKFQAMKTGMKKEATDVAILILSYISIMYLRDKEGYGKKRLNRFMTYLMTMMNDVGKYLDFNDMIDTIYEETGFKIKLPPRRFL